MLKQLTSLLTPRLVFSGLALVSLSSLLIARLYMEDVLGLTPCPLCMTQRVFIGAAGLIALIAAITHPGTVGRRIYAGFCTVFCITGGAVAARHTWLQHLPPEQVPACGPTLEYMLETLPFSETLSIVLMGDGNCAEVVWTLLGFSIPEQTLALFTVMTGVSLWQLLRRWPPGNNAD